MRRRCAKSISVSGKAGLGGKPRPEGPRNGDGSGFARFRRGDNLAIIGDNRPRFYMVFAAAQSLGGVAVPMYQDAVAAEMTFVLKTRPSSSPSSRTRNRLTSCSKRRTLPQIAHIIYEDPRGLRNYDAPGLISIDATA